MPRFYVYQPIITFTEISDYFNEHPGFDILQQPLAELLQQLTIDYQRRHISVETMMALKIDLLSLLKSIVDDVNHNRAISKLETLRRHCNYNQAIQSKWN